MKTYAACHGQRNPDGWVVVPLSTRDDPAPKAIAVFDTEADAKEVELTLNIAEEICRTATKSKLIARH